MDGREFLPVRPFPLFGYQFKAISLDPVIGPVIALQFGWLPALLWLLLGSVFIGWILDILSTLWSFRRQGNTLETLITAMFPVRIRTAFLVLLLVYLVILSSELSVLLASIMSRGETAAMVLALCLGGGVLGPIVFRWRVSPYLKVLSAGLVFLLLYGAGLSSAAQVPFNQLNQWLGEQTWMTIHRPSGFGDLASVQLLWSVILLCFCYLCAIRPIWRLTVPINQAAAWTTAISMCLAVCGWVAGISQGTLNARFQLPPVLMGNQSGVGPVWPLLFMLISTGAVSGWNALVTTHTTSHLVDRERQVLPVAGGAGLGGTILVLVVIAMASVFGVAEGLYDPGQGFKLIAGPGSVFAYGISTTYQTIGIPVRIADSFGAILFGIILIPVLLLAFRFSRDIVGELFREKIRGFWSPNLSAVLSAILVLILVLSGFWQRLWPLFPGLNQLLAGITLVAIAIWLSRERRPFRWLLLTGVILSSTAVAALGYTSFYVSIFKNLSSIDYPTIGGLIGNLATALFGSSFIVIGVVVLVETVSGNRKTEKNRDQSR